MNSLEAELASPEDFQTCRARARVERVALPKLGKAVLMRRPAPLWFVFHHCLPQTLAVRVAGQSPGTPQDPADVPKVAQWVTELLAEVMVQPRVSLTPGRDEISPDLIADEDLNYIIRWAVGEVVSEEPSSVIDLAPFRDKQTPAAARASGSNVERAAQ